jgi:hypothetical protein
VIGTVGHLHWRDLAQLVRETVGHVDTLIVDAPYSERTHSAYRDMEEVGRGSLVYASWSAADVAEFVYTWAPLTRGWIVSLTDHVLAKAWEASLAAAERYTFAPLACVEPGSRVRLSGDGPSQWSVWAVAARPRTRAAQQWGALPGAYVVPPEYGWRGNKQGRSGVIGGKPLWLMERLVEDYTRPGDLVCDPCCGAGTTLLAAKLLGRRWIGGDLDETHVELARERLRDLPAAPRRGTLALPWPEEP